MDEKRKKRYEERKEALNQICIRCRKLSKTSPSYERCDDCPIGRKLRMLEAEYSDITGWGHDKW